MRSGSDCRVETLRPSCEWLISELEEENAQMNAQLEELNQTVEDQAQELIPTFITHFAMHLTGWHSQSFTESLTDIL